MKTAMQELIDEIQYWKEKAPLGSAFKDCLIILEGSAITKLEKEKQQIIDAHTNGHNDSYEYHFLKNSANEISLRNGEEYYNENFNQNK